MNYCQICKTKKDKNTTVETSTIMCLARKRKVRKAAKKLYRKGIFEVCIKCLYREAGELEMVAKIEEQEKWFKEQKEWIEKMKEEK